MSQSTLNNETCQRMLTLFDDPRYNKMALDLRESFKKANPFPHVVIDNFLPDDIARLVSASYPDPKDPAVRWKHQSSTNISRKILENTCDMAQPLRLFAQMMSSRQLLLFLETLTEIDCLLGDPYYLGAGAAMAGQGDFLKIHADFNWNHKLQAHRRLNALLYLTPDWQESWGGHLELWAKDMTKCEKAVLPQFNRMIVFATTEDSNHGQPHPLTCPSGTYRRLFSNFYYTTRQDEAAWSDPHFTVYKPEKSAFASKLLEDYQKTGTGDVGGGAY